MYQIKLFVFSFLLLGTLNQNFGQTSGPQRLQSNSKVTPKVQTIAKLYMVIGYLETKANYKEGISKEEFLNSMFKEYSSQSIPALRKYFGVVYDFHKQNLHPDDVYQKADDKAFLAINNDFVSLYKPTMTKSQFREILQIKTAIGKKPIWINWIRKAIDLIDDNWK
jgi:hypothetical protein